MGETPETEPLLEAAPVKRRPAEKKEPLPPAPDPPRRELVFEVWVVLSVFVLPNILFALAAVIWPRSGNPRPLAYDSLSQVVTALGPSVLIIYLIYRNREAPARFGLTRPHWVADLLMGVCILLADRFAWHLLSRSFGSTFDALDAGLGIAESTDEYPVPKGLLDYFLVIVGCCATGFCEELTMRSYMLVRLENLLKSGWKSILLTTALFAAWHFHQGTVGVVGASINGLIFGIVFYWQRRLWPVAIAHAMGNFLAITRGL